MQSAMNVNEPDASKDRALRGLGVQLEIVEGLHDSLQYVLKRCDDPELQKVLLQSSQQCDTLKHCNQVLGSRLCELELIDAKHYQALTSEFYSRRGDKEVVPDILLNDWDTTAELQALREKYECAKQEIERLRGHVHNLNDWVRSAKEERVHLKSQIMLLESKKAKQKLSRLPTRSKRKPNDHKEARGFMRRIELLLTGEMSNKEYLFCMGRVDLFRAFSLAVTKLVAERKQLSDINKDLFCAIRENQELGMNLRAIHSSNEIDLRSTYGRIAAEADKIDAGPDLVGSTTAEQACLTAAKEEATRYLVLSSPMIASLQTDGNLAKLSGIVDRFLNEYCRTTEQVTSFLSLQAKRSSVDYLHRRSLIADVFSQADFKAAWTLYNKIEDSPVDGSQFLSFTSVAMRAYLQRAIASEEPETQLEGARLTVKLAKSTRRKGAVEVLKLWRDAQNFNPTSGEVEGWDDDVGLFINNTDLGMNNESTQKKAQNVGTRAFFLLDLEPVVVAAYKRERIEISSFAELVMFSTSKTINSGDFGIFEDVKFYERALRKEPQPETVVAKMKDFALRSIERKEELAKLPQCANLAGVSGPELQEVFARLFQAMFQNIDIHITNNNQIH